MQVAWLYFFLSNRHALVYLRCLPAWAVTSSTIVTRKTGSGHPRAILCVLASSSRLSPMLSHPLLAPGGWWSRSTLLGLQVPWATAGPRDQKKPSLSHPYTAPSPDSERDSWGEERRQALTTFSLGVSRYSAHTLSSSFIKVSPNYPISVAICFLPGLWHPTNGKISKSQTPDTDGQLSQRHNYVFVLWKSHLQAFIGKWISTGKQKIRSCG